MYAYSCRYMYMCMHMCMLHTRRRAAGGWLLCVAQLAERAVLDAPWPDSPSSYHSPGTSHCGAAVSETQAINSLNLRQPTPRWGKRQVLLDDFAPVLKITPVRGTESTCGLHHVLVE